MRRLLLSFGLLLVALPVLGQTLTVLPRSGEWVTDAANLMSTQERAALAAKLRVYADSTSTQIIVVTIPALDGVDAAQYATELGRQWQVGGEKLDNGIVVLISRDDRKSFIATGRGTEGAVPDVLATRITRNVMGPRFREGQFYAGLNEAVDVLISALQGEFQGETQPQAGGEETSEDFGLICLILVIVIFVLAMAKSRNRGGRGGGQRRRSGWGGPIIIGGWGGGWGGGGGGGGFSGGGGGDSGGFSGGGGDFGGGGGGSDW